MAGAPLGLVPLCSLVFRIRFLGTTGSLVAVCRVRSVHGAERWSRKSTGSGQHTRTDERHGHGILSHGLRFPDPGGQHRRRPAGTWPVPMQRFCWAARAPWQL